MIDKQKCLWIYNKMNEIRDFEETAWTLFTENKLRGSVHLYTGEEAVAASVCAQLTDEDLIASTHRGHGHCIAKGAELLGWELDKLLDMTLRAMQAEEGAIETAVAAL